MTPRSPDPFSVTCDDGRAGCGDPLGIMGFAGERRRLVQAWGVTWGQDPASERCPYLTGPG